MQCDAKYLLVIAVNDLEIRLHTSYSQDEETQKRTRPMGDPAIKYKLYS